MLISDFDKDEALQLDGLILSLFDKKEIVVTERIPVENNLGFTVIFALAEFDEGCSKHGDHFHCRLTAESWANAQERIRMFEYPTRGFHYLFDVNSSVDVVLSPSGSF